MTGDRIALRPAAPTIADGRDFARHLDTATDGLFGLLLGRGFDRIVAEAFVQPGHDLSFEHVTFAVTDGAIVGAASAYGAADHARADHRTLPKASGWRVARLVPLVVLMWPMISFLDHVPDGDHYLQAIGVDADRRGRGIGRRLIEHVEAAARRAGFRRLALDVAVENVRARNLYERIGFTVVGTSWPTLVPRTRVHRMVKPLQN